MNTADRALSEFYDGILLGKKGRGRVAHSKATVGSPRGKADLARAKLRAMINNIPEVMVKITGKGQGMKHVRNHLKYVSRNGELPLEDQDGNRIQGKAELKALADDWQRSGRFIQEVSNKREAFNLVLSMPPGTDRLAVERAVRTFAERQFSENHQYAFVRHDDEDHPHVHLVVKAVGFNGRRLNPRKADLHSWREAFVLALSENGIEAVASKRQQRLKRAKGLPQAVAHIEARGERPQSQGRRASAARAGRAVQTESLVREAYRALIKALGASTPEDRRLAGQLQAAMLEGRSLEARLEGTGDRERAGR